MALCLQYRGVILKMFQTMKSVRRRQVSDEISKELGVEPDSKALGSVLKVHHRCMRYSGVYLEDFSYCFWEKRLIGQVLRNAATHLCLIPSHSVAYCLMTSAHACYLCMIYDIRICCLY